MRKALTQFIKRKASDRDKEAAEEEILPKKNACYVLITCDEPSEDGRMQVEMTYEGDACLAAYLIESAQGIIHEDSEQP